MWRGWLWYTVIKEEHRFRIEGFGELVSWVPATTVYRFFNKKKAVAFCVRKMLEGAEVVGL